MEIGDTRKLKIVYYSAHRRRTAGREYLSHLQTTMPQTRSITPSFEDTHRLDITLGPIRGRPTTLELETAPPSERAIAERIIQLKDADGVVFIADDAETANTSETLAELRQNLEDLGSEAPVVFQFDGDVVDTLKAITKLVISKEAN